MNEIHKFCVYCGKRLPLDDEQIKLMTSKPEVSCLNCGRPVKKGQIRCDCGYEFRDIKCPECGTRNEYANRFCVSCGEKLWRFDVYNYIYDESHFEVHLFSKKLPHKLRNISVSKRYESSLKPTPGKARYTGSLQSLQSSALMVDNALSEIRSRWKVVSPNYCINCLATIMQDAYSCPKCGYAFMGDNRRVEQLRSANSYVRPAFDLPDSKFTYIFKNNHLQSLAPSIGESQFEYRERLKWEFAEANIYKNNLRKAIDMERASSRVVKTEPQERKTGNGGYCGLRCRHCYEELLDSGGGIVGDFVDDGMIDYYCTLGHPLSYGSFCEYYEE
jgi:predicted nucleic acid-binding Zn ribbon protein